MSDFTSKLIFAAEQNPAVKNLITEENAPVFEQLCAHMLEENEKINLTAITDTDGIILKHLIDSAAIVPFIDTGARIIDVGCGGGFPSLPIAILRPDVDVLGLDSVTKKVNYVSDTARLLGLGNVKTSNARAEVLGKDPAHREKYDAVCARGVGRLNLLCELCLPLIRVGGHFIAMKSLSASEELSEAEHALSVLGASLERVVDYTLTNGNEELSRTIIIIKKRAHTPSLYPRNNSQISKKPL